MAEYSPSRSVTEIKKQNITGMRLPKPLETPACLGKCPDRNNEFWTEEREKVARSVWDGIGSKLHTAYGTKTVPFCRSHLHITSLPDELDASGAIDPSTGQIYVNFSDAVHIEKFASNIAHEAGHFYGIRKILSDGSRTVTIRSGLRLTVKPVIVLPVISTRQHHSGEKIKKEITTKSIPVSLGFLDEAIIETTMQNFLAAIAPDIPELRGIPFYPKSYEQARRLCTSFVNNLVLAYNFPHLRAEWGTDTGVKIYRTEQYKKRRMTRITQQSGWSTTISPEDIYTLLEHIMWDGSQHHISTLASLVQLTYGNNAWKQLSSFSSSTNSDVLDATMSKNLWEFVSAPSQKRALSHTKTDFAITLSKQLLSLHIQPQFPLPLYGWEKENGYSEGIYDVLAHFTDCLEHPLPHESIILSPERILYAESARTLGDVSKNIVSVYCFNSLFQALHLSKSPDCVQTYGQLTLEIYTIPQLPSLALGRIQHRTLQDTFWVVLERSNEYTV